MFQECVADENSGVTEEQKRKTTDYIKTLSILSADVRAANVIGRTVCRYLPTNMPKDQQKLVVGHVT